MKILLIIGLICFTWNILLFTSFYLDERKEKSFKTIFAERGHALFTGVLVTIMILLDDFCYWFQDMWRKAVWKLKLFPLLLIVGLFSCNSEPVQLKEGEFIIKTEDWAASRSVQTVVIDSCEYLYNRGYAGTTHITHKGNCKFCRARQRETNYNLYQSLKRRR